MSTKYAKARDVAFQWRAEHRKVRQENRSLRKVYNAARILELSLVNHEPHLQALAKLRQALNAAVFAVDDLSPADQGDQPSDQQ